MTDTAMHILILGGTSEASACARRLVGDERFNATLSLAGRTSAPLNPGLALRVGGFGGIPGLARWLADAAVEAIIDATHPFAAQISSNAHAAATQLGVPLCTVLRPAWKKETGDNWRSVATMQDAVEALGSEKKRVFLGIGRQGIGIFQSARQHSYVARSIELPEASSLPPDMTLIQARGPFALQDELDLLRLQRIDIMVSKNAGGRATYAKIEAARALRLPVVMIERPRKTGGDVVSTSQEAIDWLLRLHAKSRSDRGV